MHHLCKYLSEHYDYTELTELYRQVLSLLLPFAKPRIHMKRGHPRSQVRERTLETNLERGCVPGPSQSVQFWGDGVRGRRDVDLFLSKGV